VALNAAKNAGILAAQMIGAFDKYIGQKMDQYKKSLSDEVHTKVQKLKGSGYSSSLDNDN
jgi:5-(carboxyamino)imidazole ribonucleotide mutase